MPSHGWRYFNARPWGEVREFLAKTWSDGYLLDIIDSVLAAGADSVLGVDTSMHDIIVAPIPAVSASVDVVVVRAPSTMAIVPAGLVRIEHVEQSGRRTVVDRPPDEAVHVFWRFLREEFGIALAPGTPAA